MSDTANAGPVWGEMAHFISVFSHQFFVAPADQNYYLARFARLAGLHEEFWWQGLQAIEKYLKAGLVMNGRSVKTFGHDIQALYAAHREVFADMAFTALEKPADLADDLWNSASLASFLRRVEWQGNPNTRYGLISYSNRPEDVFVLDQVVFELRRRTIGLDWIVGELWPEPDLQLYLGQPYREVLSTEPGRQFREFNVPKGSLSHVGADFSDVFHSWNRAFRRAPADTEKPLLRRFVPRTDIKNNYLHIFYSSLEVGKIDDSTAEKVRWLCDNILSSRPMVQELMKKFEAARTGRPPDPM